MKNKVRSKIINVIALVLPPLLVGSVASVFASASEALTNLAGALATDYYGGFIGVSLLCFVSAALVIRFLAPAAIGSGIPQVLAVLRRTEKGGSQDVRDLIGSHVSLVKVISGLLGSLGGSALGREGPMVQLGSSIFNTLGRKFHKISNQENLKLWTSCGAAAGVAGAFNTPLGGVVFALEELANGFFGPTKFMMITAVLISGYAAQFFSGDYLFVGKTVVGDVNITSTIAACGIGLICGVAGALFGQLLLLFRMSKTISSTIVRAAVCALIIACCAIWFPNSRYVIGGGRTALHGLLYESIEGQSHLVFLGRLITTSASYLSGIAGGVFAPSLALGGSLGGTLYDLFPIGDREMLILCGMAGFLTGISRAPFTAIVLILEMTDNHHAALPIMLSVMISLYAAGIVAKDSFYQISAERWISPLSGKT